MRFGRASILLTASLLATLGTIAPAFATPAPSAGVTLSTLKEHAENFVREQTATGHRKIVTMDVTEDSVVKNDSAVEIIYQASVTDLLDFAKPEDVPALKAKLDYIAEKSANFNAAQAAAASQDVAMWTKELQGYIDTPAEMNEQIKVTATLTSEQSVDPSSIKLSVYTFRGAYTPAGEMLDQITTLQESAAQARANIEALVNKPQVASASAAPAGTVTPMANYNRIAARDYVKKWVRNGAPAVACTAPDGGTTKQDESAYHPAYNWYRCNDCTNFVSQGLNMGNIPTTAEWTPKSPAWINVAQLVTYMRNNGYLVLGNRGNTIAGYPIALGTSHIMMTTLNDTVNFRVTGHSDDMNDLPWSDTPSSIYYNVSW